MTEELKKKWLEALESGDYRQARRYMKNKLGYCCLGVLAHIMEYEFSDDGSTCIIDGKEDNILTNNLYPLLRDKVDLSRDQINRLVRINDSSFDFSKVIDYIKDNI